MASGPRGPAPVEARQASVADVPTVAETLALAFLEDPVWSWVFPDQDRRLAQYRALWSLMIDSALDNGQVWLTDGAGAAAVWIAPGRPELSPEGEARLEPLMEEVAGDGTARVLDTFERFQAAHPDDRDHFYLSLLGTHPDRRGEGIGTGLLAETLDRIDAEGMPAFLESSNPANDRRYEGLGFRPCGEFELGEDGPAVTQMWRDPR